MDLHHETTYLRRRLLNKWDSPITGKFVSPRVAVLHRYIKNGWSGTFDKGDLLFTLLKCMSFKQLPLFLYMYETSENYSQWKDKLGKGKSIDRDGYPNIFHMFYNNKAKWRKLGLGTLDDRIDDITNITEDEIRTNAEVLVSNSPLTRDEYRGTRRRYGDYTPDMIVDLFKSIDRNILVQLAEKLSHKKYHYNFSFGYPDILVFKDGEVRFVKVNAIERDRIWDTQAFTFENLLLPLGFNISICQVQPDTEYKIPDYLTHESSESLKEQLEESILNGDLNTFNSILDNINSLSLLGFDDSSIQALLVKYFNNPKVSASVAEQFMHKLVVMEMSNEELETCFFLYFSRHADGSNYEIKKELLPVFLKLGIDMSLITAVLCEYIKKYAWDGDLKYFDERYVEFLLENGADPNLVVKAEPHDFADTVNALAVVADLIYDAANIAYSLLKTMVEHGGNLRLMIETSYKFSGKLFNLRSKRINFTLKPNHIGHDGETDVTRELNELFCIDDEAYVLKTLSMFKDVGANFNIANSNGDYPINIVIGIHNKNTQVIEYLLREGALVTFENSENQTPLIQLSSSINRKDKKTLDMVKSRIDLLIENGASVCQVTTKGLTVFHTAAEMSPALLPYLRKYIDREPNNIVEVILFNGNKALSTLDSYIKISSHHEKIQALSFAISIRLNKVVDKLLSDNINIIAATEKFREQTQKNTHHRTYPLIVLKFLAKVQHANLEGFWQHVLEIDLREKARDIASNQLRLLIGVKATSLIVKKTEKVFAQHQKILEKRTKQFLKRTEKMRTYLMNHGVFAIDFYNGGYAPSGAVYEVFDAIVETIVELSMEVDEIKYCWIDTTLATKDSRGGYDGRGPLIEAVDSIPVYYSADTEDLMVETGESIVKASKHVDLDAEWDGNVGRAVRVKLP